MAVVSPEDRGKIVNLEKEKRRRERHDQVTTPTQEIEQVNALLTDEVDDLQERLHEATTLLKRGSAIESAEESAIIQQLRTQLREAQEDLNHARLDRSEAENNLLEVTNAHLQVSKKLETEEKLCGEEKKHLESCLQEDRRRVSEQTIYIERLRKELAAKPSPPGYDAPLSSPLLMEDVQELRRQSNEVLATMRRYRRIIDGLQEDIDFLRASEPAGNLGTIRDLESKLEEQKELLRESEDTVEQFEELLAEEVKGVFGLKSHRDNLWRREEDVRHIAVELGLHPGDGAVADGLVDGILTAIENIKRVTAPVVPSGNETQIEAVERNNRRASEKLEHRHSEHIRQMRTENEQLRTENERLRAENDRLRQEQNLRRAEQELFGDGRNEGNQDQGADGDDTRIILELEQARKDETTELKKKITELEQDLKDLREADKDVAAGEVLRKEKQEVEKQLTNVRLQLIITNQDCEQWIKRNEELRAEIAHTQRDNDRKDAKIKELESENEDLTAALEGGGDDDDDNDPGDPNLRRDNIAKTRKIRELQGEVADLQLQLDDCLAHQEDDADLESPSKAKLQELLKDCESVHETLQETLAAKIEELRKCTKEIKPYRQLLQRLQDESGNDDITVLAELDRLRDVENALYDAKEENERLKKALEDCGTLHEDGQAQEEDEEVPVVYPTPIKHEEDADEEEEEDLYGASDDETPHRQPRYPSHTRSHGTVAFPEQERQTPRSLTEDSNIRRVRTKLQRLEREAQELREAEGEDPNVVSYAPGPSGHEDEDLNGANDDETPQQGPRDSGLRTRSYRNVLERGPESEQERRSPRSPIQDSEIRRLNAEIRKLNAEIQTLKKVIEEAKNRSARQRDEIADLKKRLEACMKRRRPSTPPPPPPIPPRKKRKTSNEAAKKKADALQAEADAWAANPRWHDVSRTPGPARYS